MKQRQEQRRSENRLSNEDHNFKEAMQKLFKEGMFDPEIGIFSRINYLLFFGYKSYRLNPEERSQALDLFCQCCNALHPKVRMDDAMMFFETLNLALPIFGKLLAGSANGKGNLSELVKFLNCYQKFFGKQFLSELDSLLDKLRSKNPIAQS